MGAAKSAILTTGTGEAAAQRLDPFVTQGPGSGLQLQQRLSGAAGPEAQAQAFSEFEESPGVAFLREQGLRLSGSRAGAEGVGGGERLRELTKFSQGLALQDLSSQFARAGEVAGREQDLATFRRGAATEAGGLRERGAARAGESLLRGAEGQARLGVAGETGRAGILSRGAEVRSELGLRGAEGRGEFELRGAEGRGDFLTGGARARAEGDVAGSAGLRGGVTQIAGGISGFSGGGGGIGALQGAFGV